MDTSFESDSKDESALQELVGELAKLKLSVADDDDSDDNGALDAEREKIMAAIQKAIKLRTPARRAD